MKLISAIVLVLRDRFRDVLSAAKYRILEENNRKITQRYHYLENLKREKAKADCPHTREDKTCALVRVYFPEYQINKTILHEQAVCQRCQLITTDPNLIKKAECALTYNPQPQRRRTKDEKKAYDMPLAELKALAGGYAGVNR